MDQREEFVRLALLEGANRRELCRRFGISAETGYKWLKRFASGEARGFEDRSRGGSLSSPLQLESGTAQRICEVRTAQPTWRARKIKAFLEARGHAMPAASTVHQVLKRQGLSRYRPSHRPFPRKLPEPHYEEGTITRQVSTTKSYVAFMGRHWKVPDAFQGERLAIHPLNQDGKFGVFFASHHIATIDLTE